MSNLLRISVIIPVFNGETTIAYSIRSILRQTIKPDEIIVVDDGSTDATFQIASRYSVKIVRHRRNLGVACARNTGILATQSEIVVFVDADCIAGYRLLQYVIENFKNDPLVAAVGGREIPIYVNGIANICRAHRRQGWGPVKVYNPPYLFGLCSAFKREKLIEVGLYDPRFRTNAEDIDICLRLKSQGYKLVYDPRMTVFHLRGDNVSSLLKLIYRSHYFGTLAYLKNVGCKEERIIKTWIEALIREIISKNPARMILAPFTVSAETLGKKHALSQTKYLKELKGES